MSYEPQGQPFSESNLDSPEYRLRLMRKLNCLIAVLEVATAKVRRTLEMPGADVERLTRIRRNLQETLDVCLRARTALEKRGKLPEGIADQLSQVVHPEALSPRALARENKGKGIEMSSREEAAKFSQLSPIQKDAVKKVDLDQLSRLLQF